MGEAPEKFYNRADAMIDLANSQLEGSEKGQVSASTLYAAARFNVWITATGFHGGAEMEERSEEITEYFVSQYKEMFKEHLEDYIKNFDDYMRPK